MQKLENNVGNFFGTDPHNQKEGKRETRKQRLTEADDELLSTSARRDSAEKAKRINVDGD